MAYMQTNLPRWDRSLRLSLALLFAWVALHQTMGVAILVGFLASFLLFMALSGHCPICALFGRKLQPARKRNPCPMFHS